MSLPTNPNIDWLCTRGDKIRCVEVKTVKKFLYSFVGLPTFKIPLAKYDAYKAEAEKRGGVLELWFVSSEDAKIYWATSDKLDKKFRRAGFDFPATVTFDGDTNICFHAGQFARHAIAAADLTKLRALDAEMKIADNRIKGTVFKFSKYLRTSGDARIEVFAADGKAFVYLPQLKSAGVDTSSIPKSKRYVHGDYPAAFANVEDLSEIFTASADAQLSAWWTTSGHGECQEMLGRFLSAQDLLRKHLAIDLPDDWPKLTAAGDALVERWTPKLERLPVCFLRRLGGEMYRLATSLPERNFATTVSEKCSGIIDERPKPIGKLPVVVKMSGAARKISELQTPDGKTLEFFTVKGCDKIFVHGAQLAVACGYPNQAGTTADNTDFTKPSTPLRNFILSAEPKQIPKPAVSLPLRTCPPCCKNLPSIARVTRSFTKQPLNFCVAGKTNARQLQNRLKLRRHEPTNARRLQGRPNSRRHELTNARRLRLPKMLTCSK